MPIMAVNLVGRAQPVATMSLSTCYGGGGEAFHRPEGHARGLKNRPRRPVAERPRAGGPSALRTPLRRPALHGQAGGGPARQSKGSKPVWSGTVATMSLSLCCGVFHRPGGHMGGGIALQQTGRGQEAASLPASAPLRAPPSALHEFRPAAGRREVGRKAGPRGRKTHNRGK